RSVEQLEIRRAVHLDLRQPREETIKGECRMAAKGALLAAIALHRFDDQITLAPTLEHRRDELRRMLQIGVENDESVGVGTIEPDFQARVDRRFLAEVARERDKVDRTVLPRELHQYGEAPIRRTVVDGKQPYIDTGRRRSHRAEDAWKRSREDRGLVVNGHHQ